MSRGASAPSPLNEALNYYYQLFGKHTFDNILPLQLFGILLAYTYHSSHVFYISVFTRLTWELTTDFLYITIISQ